MSERSFLNDMLTRIAQAGRRARTQETDEASALQLFERLLGDEGEASGLATGMQAMERYSAATSEEKQVLFEQIAESFGVDDDALTQAIQNWAPGNTEAARKLHFAAEPKSQELIRRLNRMPGATAKLVKMREDLIALSAGSPQLKSLDQDFQHLFSSWFNRGFLEIRRIDWNTSAHTLEKIIAYEAVHEIKG